MGDRLHSLRHLRILVVVALCKLLFIVILCWVHAVLRLVTLWS